MVRTQSAPVLVAPTPPEHVDGSDMLAACDGGLICRNTDRFDWHIILPVKLIPLDRADSIQYEEGQREQPDQAAQHNANPLKNFAYHIVHLNSTKWLSRPFPHGEANPSQS